MPVDQASIVPRGHAIEVRVNAEDPWTFRPSPGRITGYHAPGVESASTLPFTIRQRFSHSTIPWSPSSSSGQSRDHAIQRMLGAIDEYVVEGIATTLPIQQALIDDPLFREYVPHALSTSGSRSGQLIPAERFPPWAVGTITGHEPRQRNPWPSIACGWSRSLKLLQRGKTDSAIERFLRDDPRDRRIQQQIAELYIRQGAFRRRSGTTGRSSRP